MRGISLNPEFWKIGLLEIVFVELGRIYFLFIYFIIFCRLTVDFGAGLILSPLFLIL